MHGRAEEPESKAAPGAEAGGVAWKAKVPARARMALVFLAALLLGSVARFAVERRGAEAKVLRGISLFGEPLGGLDRAASTAAVERLASRFRALPVRVSVSGRSFDVTAEGLGVELDQVATRDAALAAGRENSIFGQFFSWVARSVGGEEVPLRVRTDAPRAAAAEDRFELAALGEPAVEGAVAFTDRVVSTYPRGGRALDRTASRRRVEAALSTARAGAMLAVELPVVNKTPRSTRADVDRVRAEAERMVAAPVVFASATGEKSLTLDTADLGRALRSRIVDAKGARLEVLLDRDALRAVIDRSRTAIETPPRNATFDVAPRHEVTVVPSALGTRIDDEALLAAIVRLAAGTERRGALPLVEDVAPALTTEQANALGIKGLVAQYTTRFPCCEARVKNIERMAALVDGRIVKPGERFSLNAVSGPRTTANGFVAGPTIVEGEMEMTVGGGVSQFATTIFNAAFDGGYEIVQRQAHTYWFPRYPEGHDATLGYPLPDLIFGNDTSAGVLVRAEVARSHVKVSLYGDNGGRRVERHVSGRFDIVKPEEELEPDPSLRPDETKVLFGGVMGWSVLVSRTLTMPDGQKKEERRKVVYFPRARRVATHPCHILEGEPGYTGEDCPEIEEPDGGQ